VIGDIDPAEIGTMLDLQGIAVRTGQHCAQPVMARFGLSGTVRASFAFYNTMAEIDALADGLGRITTMFQGHRCICSRAALGTVRPRGEG
jgi:cysteine desulfurase/selenocysteine lyase